MARACAAFFCRSMPDCFCANRLTLRGCAGLQRFSALVAADAPFAAPAQVGSHGARLCTNFLPVDASDFLRLCPENSCAKLQVFSNPYRDRFGWACVCGGVVPPRAHGRYCGPMCPHKSHCREIKGALLDPAAFSAPPRTHASCLHVCIVSACLWRACMHCTCIVPACMHASFSCLHDAFFFDVHGLLCTTWHACFWTACVHRARMPAACLHARWIFFRCAGRSWAQYVAQPTWQHPSQWHYLADSDSG